MATMRVASSCSQEGGKGRQWSTRGSQPRGSQIVVSTRNARFGPPRLRSQQPKGLLVITTKKEEKENDNRHEDHEQEGHK